MSLGLMWRLLRYPFMLLMLAVVPPMMGDAAYGRYAYFVALFVLLDLATDVGMLQVCGRFVPEVEGEGQPDALRALFQGLLGFNAVVGLVLVALALGLSAGVPLPGLPAGAWLVLGIMVALARVEGALYAFLYGLNRIAHFSARDSLRSVLTLLLVVAGYRYSGLRGALAGLVLNEVALLALGLWWTRAYLRPESAAALWQRVKPALGFGLRFYAPCVLFGLMQRSGNVFVWHLTARSEEVAYFDIANQFLLLTSVFLGLLLQTLLPALRRLHLRHDRETIQRWQRVVLVYGLMLAVLAYNALLWLGPPLIHAWVGTGFDPVVANARVMALALVPLLLAYVGMNYALLDKTPGVYTAAVVAGMAGMALGNLWWTPRWGSWGASWASVAGFSMMGMVFVLHLRRRLRTLWRPFLGTLVAGLAVVLPGWMVHSVLPYRLLWFAVSSLLFGALLAALRIVRRADVRRVAGVWRGRLS